MGCMERISALCACLALGRRAPSFATCSLERGTAGAWSLSRIIIVMQCLNECVNRTTAAAATLSCWHACTMHTHRAHLLLRTDVVVALFDARLRRAFFFFYRARSTRAIERL